MGEKDILIHVGIHKTGTTWLQKNIFATLNGNFHSLSLGGEGKASIARDFVRGQEGNLLNSFDLNQEVLNTELAQTCLSENTAENTVYVISDERLGGNPHSAGFDAHTIMQRLHKTFPKAKIFIVIREQRSWLLSNYFQYLTVGGTKSLKAYLNTAYDGKIPGFSPDFLKYHLMIGAYQNAFGKDRVLVLTYEQFKNDKADFLKGLGAFTNRDIKTREDGFEQYENRTKQVFTHYYLRYFNKYITSSSLNVNHRGSGLGRLTGILLKKAMTMIAPVSWGEMLLNKLENYIDDWTEGRYESSNEITSQLTGLDIKKKGYR
ncbi:MAG: sulfotransferase [Roseivirga sp.]